MAVEIAPASVCGSTSPWFSIASPRERSSSPSSCSVIPASTVTSMPSTDSTRLIARMSIITPSVHAMSVNEWPEPATFTRAAPDHGADQLLLARGA